MNPTIDGVLGVGPREVVTPLPFMLDAPRLDDVAARVRPLVRAKTVDTAMAIAKAVIAGIYGGCRPEDRPDRRKQKVTLRALAARLDGELSASKLSRYIGVYDMLEDLADVAPAQRLPLGHLEVVLPLDRARRVQLLSAAYEQGWSRRELYRHVYQANPPGDWRRGGRPARAPMLKLLDLLLRFHAEHGLPRDLGAVRSLAAPGIYQPVVRDALAVLAEVAVALRR